MMQLGLCNAGWLTQTDLSDGVDSNCNDLVVNLLGNVLIDDLLNDGVNLIRGYQIVDGLSYHGQDFRDKFLMWVDVLDDHSVEGVDE